MNLTSCVVCGAQDLRLGFIPDAGDQMSQKIMAWFEGEPEENKFLGLRTGNVKTDSKSEPIISYKCASCGYIHLFGKPEETNDIESS